MDYPFYFLEWTIKKYASQEFFKEKKKRKERDVVIYQ